MHDVLQLSARAIVAAVARRELTAEAVTRAYVERIAAVDAGVRAWQFFDPALAIEQACALDRVGPIGALHGLPIGVKDLMDTADMPTAYGSPIYEGHRPLADAACVAACRAAGAVILGKTVTTEFATFQPGVTRNPRAAADAARTPGGSSSGSAAAVAAGMVPLAFGTQTAGSIIRPAAYCGVVGYKASLGRVPRAGIKTLSETLDAFGGFGRSVRDVALLGAVLTGDARLTRSSDRAAPRIAIVRTPEWPQADADIGALFDALPHALAGSATTIVEIDLPALLADGVALQKRVMAHEMARALSHERVRHPDRLGPRLRALLDEGMAIDGAQHAADLARTDLMRAAAERLFDDHDVVLAPSATGEAPRGLDATGDPVFCRLWTLLGLPCVHLPVGVGRHGLPIGLQAIGRRHDDQRLLGFADRIHRALTR